MLKISTTKKVIATVVCTLCFLLFGTFPVNAEEAAAQTSPVPEYVVAIVLQLENAYQSYELTKATQYATPAVLAGTPIVEKYFLGDAIYSSPDCSWKGYIYNNVIYYSSVSTFDSYWDITVMPWEPNYEYAYDMFGISLPYVTHKFTEEEIRLVTACLNSPVVYQRDQTGTEHTFVDQGKFDAHSSYNIYGYYKGLPVQILLEDSFARYAPDYHFVPQITISFRITPDGLPISQIEVDTSNTSTGKIHKWEI